MPFTLVHPAAVIPLPRGRLVPSGLVVGAMAPDLVGMVPVPNIGLFSRMGLLSHSWLGTITVVPLVSVLTLALYHGLLKRPLVDLAPHGWRGRLAGPAAGFGWSNPYVLPSIVIGAATHLVWDDFTHGTFIDWGSSTQLVQDGCSVVGLGLIVWWLARWYRTAPRTEATGGLGRAAGQLPARLSAGWLPSRLRPRRSSRRAR